MEPQRPFVQQFLENAPCTFAVFVGIFFFLLAIYGLVAPCFHKCFFNESQKYTTEV
jgi:hypothetical protein